MPPINSMIGTAIHQTPTTNGKESERNSRTGDDRKDDDTLLIVTLQQDKTGKEDRI